MWHDIQVVGGHVGFSAMCQIKWAIDLCTRIQNESWVHYSLWHLKVEKVIKVWRSGALWGPTQKLWLIEHHQHEIFFKKNMNHIHNLKDCGIGEVDRELCLCVHTLGFIKRKLSLDKMA